MQSFLHRPFPRALTAVVLAILFSAGNASAAALLKVNLDPGNFDEMKAEVNKVQGDLSQAQCGGWNFEKSLKDVRINGGEKGAVPKVTGAPGRKGIVFDNDDNVIPQVLESGMSLREEGEGAKENGFVFPDKTRASGWSTVCNVRECEGSFPYVTDLPENIPCKDRKECADMCPELNLWQKNHMICTATWIEWEWQLTGWDEEGNEIWEWVPVERSETRDETSPCYNIEHVDGNGVPWDLCHPGDSWKPLDQRMQEERPEASVECELNEMRYCCSESIVNDRNEDPSRNCIPCQGDGLEVGGGRGDFNGDGIGDLYQTGCRKGKNATENEGNGREYFSYFREYKATYERNKVQADSDDNSRFDLPLLCFGRYDERAEFDPKIRRLKPPDRHCAIDAFTDPNQRFDRMKETQKIKGEYGQNSNFPDPAYPAASRDTVNDIWHTDLGAAFSLLNGEKAKKKFGEDLPLTLLSLDTADQRATPQMTKEKPLSEGSLIRATDDTVANDRPGRRTIVEWWQEEESEMHKLFTPPTVRLILPSPWSEDLDITQPLLTPDIPEEGEKEPNDTPPHTRTIDIQLHAEEDLLGEVQSYLEDSLLLHIREEPLPVLIPLASPTELRALANGWKSWIETQEDDENAGGAQAVVDLLEGYAKQIEDVRILRGELAKYTGSLLSFQLKMTRIIADWMKENAETFNTLYAQWGERLTLKPRWEYVQQLYRKFHDQANMPWCRNDRFTIPVYSLLDDWMPGPDEPRDLLLNLDQALDNHQNGADVLPRIKVETLPDLVYDFTPFRVSTGTIILPVLKPIQVQIDQTLFNPPAYFQSPDLVAEQLRKILSLPAVPPVPKISDEVIEKIFPTELVHDPNDKPTLPSAPPAGVDIVPIEEALRNMEEIFNGMIRTYDRFWQSIIRYDGPRENGIRCESYDQLPCVHDEMDLFERVTRIGARPDVQLTTDIDSKGFWRTDLLKGKPGVKEKLPSTTLFPNTDCPREDWACQIFNVEMTYPREGWRVEGTEIGATEEALQKLRERVREETLPNDDEEDVFPYFLPGNELLPSFNVPSPMNLDPLAESSSAAP